MIAATILSAGVSSRMGYPKALLEYHGATFLQTILDACRAMGVERRIVVVGDQHLDVLERHDLQDVTVLHTQDFGAGPIGSIRAAVQAVLSEHPVEGLLVWPVDIPHVAIDTIRLLADGFRSSGLPIAVPVFDGRRGHPVIFGRSVFGELLEAPDGEGAKAVVHADPGRVVEVAVHDEAVIEDLNTPEAYKRLMKREDAARE